MSSSPCISVVIPVYNNAAELACCLSALQRSDLSPQLETIIIDDGSSTVAEAIEQVASHYRATYFRQAVNGGPGVARNRGAELATGEIIVFLDSDCVAPSDWLAKLTRPILEGSCSATTACYCGPLKSNWITDFQDEDYLYRMPSTECETYFVNSCNLAVKRDAFFACGGFPNQRVSEDMVLGMRLAENGTPARFLPEAGVQHAYYENLKSYLKQRFSFGVNTIRSYFERGRLRSQQTKSSIRSFNPIRIGLGLFFGSLTLICVFMAGIVAIFKPDLAPLFLVGVLLSFLLEMSVHGRFLLFLKNRHGLRRSTSYIFLLFIIDVIYSGSLFVGLILGLRDRLIK
ncbi:MAG: glycosyltransferase [Phycisphaerae bacterium]|nr:glycosyltransferase [Phycisphaerae bacterium]